MERVIKSFKKFVTDKIEKEPVYNKVYIGKDFDTNTNKKPTYHKVFIGKVGKLDKIDEAYDFSKVATKSDNFSTEGRLESSQRNTTLRQHYDFSGDYNHRRAIRYYTTSAYRRINGPMYKGEEITDPDAADAVPHLKAALTKHKAPEDIPVHSGIKYDPRKLPVDDDNVIRVTNPAFTSTSLHSHIAKGFVSTDADEKEKHMIHFTVPKGSHGAYVDHHSDNEGEREFVLHPNARLEMHPTPEVEDFDTWNGMGKLYHWRARLVHDGVQEVGK